MAVNIREQVANLVELAQCDAAERAAIIAAFKAAAGGLLTAGGVDQITDATKNAVSYRVISNLPETDRITILRLTMQYLRLGVAPSSKTIARL